MKKLPAFFLLLPFLLVQNGLAKTVPKGAKLTISITYRDNNNLLRNKGGGYAIAKDGYAQTIWVEGPYHPDSACIIKGFERQKIKLTKIISYFAFGANRNGSDLVPNSMAYGDYNAPDFVAALMVSGMHYYCDPAFKHFEYPLKSIKSPANAKRQDPKMGGEWCDKSSVVCFPVDDKWKASITDITMVPDGISSATVYPDSQVTFMWDMVDHRGNRIEEGHYLVHCQFSSERHPRDIESNITIDNRRPVGIETCWDDPHYDTLGHHRVVNLLKFSDSAFVLFDFNEKKWPGDPFYYLKEPATFAYITPNANLVAKDTSFIPGPTGTRDTVPKGRKIQEGKLALKYKSGEPRLDYTMKNNAPDGKFIVFFKSGSKRIESEYQNGVRCGIYKEWYKKDNQLKLKLPYKNGKVHGKTISWHGNGAMKSKGRCNHGKRIGKYTVWHDNGQKASVCSYKNGLKEGKEKTWLPDGTLDKASYYANGKLKME